MWSKRDSNDCLEPHEYRPRGRWKSSIVNFRTPLQKQIILFTLHSHVEPTAESPYPTIGFDGDQAPNQIVGKPQLDQRAMSAKKTDWRDLDFSANGPLEEKVTRYLLL
jgi:hypothetical protein